MRKPGAILGEVLSHLFKQPATCDYPAVRAQIPNRFRGKIICFESKCVGCKICIRDCPANGISLTKVADKQFQITIDLARCLYCAQCVDSCPRKALETSSEFELASLDRAALKVRVNTDLLPPAA